MKRYRIEVEVVMEGNGGDQLPEQLSQEWERLQADLREALADPNSERLYNVRVKKSHFSVTEIEE